MWIPNTDIHICFKMSSRTHFDELWIMLLFLCLIEIFGSHNQWIPTWKIVTSPFMSSNSHKIINQDFSFHEQAHYLLQICMYNVYILRTYYLYYYLYYHLYYPIQTITYSILSYLIKTYVLQGESQCKPNSESDAGLSGSREAGHWWVIHDKDRVELRTQPLDQGIALSEDLRTTAE